MNYIYQINYFWDKFEQLDDGKPQYLALYFALIQINNKCGWKRVFSVNFSQILNYSRLNKNSYYEACNWLFENGFLEKYIKGYNQFTSAKFSIKVLYPISESNKKALGTQTECKQNIHKHSKQEKIINNIQEIDFLKILFFFENNSLDKREAEKFYNYNQSRGWKNIENWEYAAKNWIINNKDAKKNENRRNKPKNNNKHKLDKQDYNSRF